MLIYYTSPSNTSCAYKHILHNNSNYSATYSSLLYFFFALVCIQLSSSYIHQFIFLYLFRSIFISIDTCESSPSPCASELLRNSLELLPSSVTSAISSAWLWRNMLNSMGLLDSMVPIDLHLPDTVTDRASKPITALETDRHSFYRWDEVGWVWLIDRLSLSHWGITNPSPCSGRSKNVFVNRSGCKMMLLHRCA